MQAGGRGYVVKGAQPEEFMLAVRAVARGEAIFSPTIAVRFMEYFDQIGISSSSYHPKGFAPEPSMVS